MSSTTASCTHKPPRSSRVDALVSVIERLASDQAARDGVHGVELGVLAEGTPATRRLGRAVTGRLGSLSKVVAGAAVLRSVEPSELLRPVAPLLGGALWSAAATRATTLDQLLSHTSGCGDWDEHLAPDDCAELPDAARRLPAVAAPDSQYSYSNAGFALALAAVARSECIISVLTRRVIKPLGMTSTVVSEEHGEVDGAVQGIRSSARDLLALAGFLLEARRRDDSASGSVARMFRARTPATGAFTVARAMYRRVVAEVEVFQHGGAGDGFGALLLLVPARSFALVVLDDAGGSFRLMLAERVLDLVLGRRRGLDCTPRVTGLRDAVWYFGDARRSVIIARHGDRGELLEGAADDPFLTRGSTLTSIAFRDEHEFVAVEDLDHGPAWPYAARLIRVDEGRVVGVCLDDRLIPSRDRQPKKEDVR